MTLREKFKRAVIEAIHGLSYEEACDKEAPNNTMKTIPRYIHQITIGRVMEALNGKEIKGLSIFIDNYGHIYHSETIYDSPICQWKLTKEDGQECTDDSQTDETIEALYQLIK